MATDKDLTASAQHVAASMAAHATAVKQRQSSARAAARPGPKAAAEPKSVDRIAVLVAWRKAATAPEAVLEAVDAAVRRGSSKPRTSVPKADPATVAAFFKASGLTPKQLAEAVGVSTSVISTVQRENGDRWSVERFERAKTLILAAAKRLATKAPR